MEHVTAPLTGGPTLRMPLQAAPVSRQRSGRALDPAADGVQASGLGGFVGDLLGGKWTDIGKDIFDWILH